MTRNLNYKEVENKIIKEIELFFKKTNCEKIVVGISGGADSALVTTLCVKALGREKVLGVLLPYGKQIDIVDSKKIAEDLKIEYKVIDIKQMADECNKKIESSKELVKANIMARCRMTMLYAIANDVNGIVAGTTNKSELAVGYGTKYGDLACDFEVIVELYKTEVWQLLIKLGTELNLPILHKIAEKKPSAGLWLGQTDEDEFGFSYIDLDSFLQGEKTDKKIELRIKKMIEISEHKRYMPPFIKIG